jgi:hypothetical protein
MIHLIRICFFHCISILLHGSDDFISFFFAAVIAMMLTIEKIAASGLFQTFFNVDDLFPA